MKSNRILGATLLTTACLLVLAPTVKATPFPDFTYTVTLNVNSLNADPNGLYSLDLQLVTGSGNVANTVTISNFAFVGGAPVGSPSYSMGNPGGSIASNGTVTLTNTGSDNEIAEEFSPGTSVISFKVDETPNSEVVGSGTAMPDQFNIAILDNGLNNITTNDPSGGNTLVNSALGTNATLNDFVSTGQDGNGGVIAITATPEPVSGWLGLIAACGMVGMLRLRRRQA